LFSPAGEAQAGAGNSAASMHPAFHCGGKHSGDRRDGGSFLENGKTGDGGQAGQYKAGADVSWFTRQIQLRPGYGMA
jgi:hypothetical protein